MLTAQGVAIVVCCVTSFAREHVVLAACAGCGALVVDPSVAVFIETLV